jgi:hypothetical protein
VPRIVPSGGLYALIRAAGLFFDRRVRQEYRGDFTGDPKHRTVRNQQNVGQPQKGDESPGLGCDPRDAANRVPSPTAIAAYFKHCIVWLNRISVLGENDVWDGVLIETPQYFA